MLVLDVYPANSAQGIPIGDSVTALFDIELDADSVNEGTFLLLAPDKDVVFGAELSPLVTPETSTKDILNSPYFTGYVEGDITVQYVNDSGGEIESYGPSSSARTKIIFTPKRPLAPNVQYTALILGDEDQDGDFDSGVKSRTVFDTLEVNVVGNGSMTFGGGYVGSSDLYHVKITKAGSVGTAEYEWWKESDPLVVYDGVSTTGKRELENGLYVQFDHDGVLEVGDEWRVNVVPYELMDTSYRWSFYTGSGSISTPPSNSSASGIDALSQTAEVPLSVSFIEPDGTNLDPDSITQIIVKFSKDLDVTTITDSSVTLVAESVNGDSDIDAAGTLDKTLSASNSTLTIDISTDLLENNIVELTLDDSIKAVDGTSLESDYSGYFTTTYNPLYSSVRKVRLGLGPVAKDISNDAINLAIFEASLKADAIDFQTNHSNIKYFKYMRQEYVTCLAEYIILSALLGDGSLTSGFKKTLGDLSISRYSDTEGLNKKLEDLTECIEQGEAVIKSGGDSVRPSWSVKGLVASDRITTERIWSKPTHRQPHRSASNTTTKGANSRRRRRDFRRSILDD